MEVLSKVVKPVNKLVFKMKNRRNANEIEKLMKSKHDIEVEIDGLLNDKREIEAYISRVIAAEEKKKLNGEKKPRLEPAKKNKNEAVSVFAEMMKKKRAENMKNNAEEIAGQGLGKNDSARNNSRTSSPVFPIPEKKELSCKTARKSGSAEENQLLDKEFIIDEEALFKKFEKSASAKTGKDNKGPLSSPAPDKCTKTSGTVVTAVETPAPNAKKSGPIAETPGALVDKSGSTAEKSGGSLFENNLLEELMNDDSLNDEEEEGILKLLKDVSAQDLLVELKDTKKLLKHGKTVTIESF